MNDNERTVRAYYAAVDRGNIDEVLDLFAIDARYHRPGYGPMHGREELRRFYADQRMLVGGRHELELVLSRAEHVSCYGRYRGQKRNGEPVDVLFADFHHVIDNHIVERRTFFFAPSV